MTGEPWDWTNWAAGQPSGAPGGDERYLSIWGYGAAATRRWRWNDDADHSHPQYTHGYFVEYPVPEPGTLALVCVGAAATVCRRRRRDE